MDERKRYNPHKNVLTAAEERIAWTFDEFEKVYVSFSAGKELDGDAAPSHGRGNQARAASRGSDH